MRNKQISEINFGTIRANWLKWSKRPNNPACISIGILVEFINWPNYPNKQTIISSIFNFLKNFQSTQKVIIINYSKGWHDGHQQVWKFRIDLLMKTVKYTFVYFYLLLGRTYPCYNVLFYIYIIKCKNKNIEN